MPLSGSRRGTKTPHGSGGCCINIYTGKEELEEPRETEKETERERENGREGRNEMQMP